MKFLKVLKSRNGRPIQFDEVEPKIERICQKYDIGLLYLFGSYAVGEATGLSDLDVGILPDGKFTLDDLLHLTSDLQEVFEEEAIDVVDLRKAPPTLIHRVLRHGRCLYARDLRMKIENEARWQTLYMDTEPLRRERFEALKRRLQDGTFGTR